MPPVAVAAAARTAADVVVDPEGAVAADATAASQETLSTADLEAKSLLEPTSFGVSAVLEEETGNAWSETKDLLESANRGDSTVQNIDAVESIMEEGVRGTSSAQTVFNIVKDIVGQGMLSLPAAMAAGTGLLVAIVISAAFGVLFGYTFLVLGRVCHASRTTNQKDATLAVFGPRLAQTISVVNMLKTTATCVSYCMVIGDTYSHALHFFGVVGPVTQPASVLVAIVVLVLLPLCLQRDLSILSYFSLFGVLCEIFVVAAMQVRLADGSYAPGGKYFKLIPEDNRVDWGDADGPALTKVGVASFVLLGSLSTAFVGHYNAPKFYVQMRAPSPQRFGWVILVAFCITFLIYAWVMCVGYLTFGGHCRGLVLDNYAEADALVTAARMAIGVAVLFGFPLIFTALRDSFVLTFNIPIKQRGCFLLVTLGLLGGVTALGCSLTDLGLVNSLGGAIFGALIAVVFPAVLIYHTGRAITTGKLQIQEKVSRLEMAWAASLVPLGGVLLTVGSAVVLLQKYRPEMLAGQER